MIAAIDFLQEFIPHFYEDQPKWDLWKAKFVTSVKTSTVNLFWYLSSGIDVMPLYFFGRQNKDSDFPRVGLFIFSDFGVVFNEPERLKNDIKRGKHQTLPSGKGKFVLKQFIPLQWKQDPKNEVEDSSLGVKPTSFNGAPVFFLQVKNQSEEMETSQPVLFFRKSNQLMLQYFKRKNLNFKYICTVSDGCRLNHPGRCPNIFLSSYMTVLKQDGFFITDHFIDQPPEMLRKVAEFKDWGHYDMHDKSYCFSRK